MRLLFAIHGAADPHTAVYLTTMRRVEYLRAEGHEVEVATPAVLPFGSYARLQPLLMPPALALRDLGKYDVVIFHSHLAWAFEVRRWLLRTARPAAVVAFHGLEPLYYDALARELARTGERLSPQFVLFQQVLVGRLLKFAAGAADRVFCLNSQERRFLVAEGWTAEPRIAVLANGVERELFIQRSSYTARGLRFLFTGQWLRAKGIRYLTEAFALICLAHPDAELTCAGTGAPVDTVKASFPSGVRDRVRVLPRVDRAQLKHELARADVFLFPSLSEGFGAALIEALAAALPVVTTAVGVAADAVEDGRNAVIVPPADAPALSAAVMALVEDPDRRARLGRMAQETARRYEWDVVNAAYAREIARAAVQR